jgi:hypothetical protein
VKKVTNDGGPAETYFFVGLDANNYYRIVKSGDGVLYFQARANGVPAGFSTVFYNSTYRWWRIRHVPATDQIVFETSPDSVTWTTNFSIARQFSNAGVKVSLNAGTFSTTVAPGNAIFDNFLFSIGGAPFPPLMPITMLTDDFNDNTGPPSQITKWVLGNFDGANDLLTPVEETNQQLRITPRVNVSGANKNGYTSTDSFDFYNSSATVEVVQPTSGNLYAETYFYVGKDENNWYRIVAGDPPPTGKLYFEWRVNGANPVIPFPRPEIDSSLHRFWRIRHDPAGDLINFETSGDGQVWTTYITIPTQFQLTGLKINLSSGTHGPTAVPGTAIFDNLKLISNRR